MAALIFDTGALIALERDDREVGRVLREATEQGMEVITSSACIAQVWRDPTRQARLVRVLVGFLERPLDALLARRCGLLLAQAGTDDVVDAAVALLAEDGDTILTSDPADIERLLAAAATDASVRPV